MKKQYNDPRFEISVYDMTDILTNSPGSLNNDGIGDASGEAGDEFWT